MQMTTRSRDERQEKTRDEISDAGLRTRIFGRGRRTAVGKVRQSEQLFPDEISLSAGLARAREIFSVTAKKEKEEKMNETRRLMAGRVRTREKSSGDSAAR